MPPAATSVISLTGDAADQYKTKAATYDSYRHPKCGWETIVEKLQGVSDKSVLDLGCGTGSFFDKLIALSPAAVDACDPSQEMIDVAADRQCVKDASPPVKVWCGGTENVADDTYEFVTCFQVLQNLSDDAEKAASIRVDFLKEIKRVMAPGGKAVITTRFRPPASEGGRISDMYWYGDSAVVPKSVEFMQNMVPADPVAEAQEAGFVDCVLFNSPDTMIREDAYLRGELVGEAAFRSGDSFFARIEQSGELPALLANIDKLKGEGKLDEYITERNKLRGEYGHVGVLCVTK